MGVAGIDGQIEKLMAGYIVVLLLCYVLCGHTCCMGYVFSDYDLMYYRELWDYNMYFDDSRCPRSYDGCML